MSGHKVEGNIEPIEKLFSVIFTQSGLKLTNSVMTRARLPPTPEYPPCLATQLVLGHHKLT